MRAILFLSLLLILVSCLKKEKLRNLNNGKVDIVGHGGMGFQSEKNQLPHNSLTSILKTIEAYNADGVEIDVQLCKDGEIFMYHDFELQSMTDCYGCLRNFTSGELKKCRFRNNFTTNVFSREHLSTLDTILYIFSQRKLKPKIFLDIKSFHTCSEDFFNGHSSYIIAFAEKLKALIAKHNAHRWVFVQFNNINDILLFKKTIPDIKYILESDAPINAIELANYHGLWGILFNNENIHSGEILLAHQSGLRVILFNIKTRKSTIEAINKAPDIIQTDNIPLLIECLR
jgi:glycerophosphoryl diester phosphodiesterase